MLYSACDYPKIIKAETKHLHGIATIETERISPWIMGQIEDELALPHGWQFVALHQQSSTVLGYIFGSTCLDEAEIRNFAVLKQSRRQGYGSALLNHSLLFLQSLQIKKCFLELRESNSNALKIYESFGFKKIALRKSYYNNPCEHAIILQNTL